MKFWEKIMQVMECIYKAAEANLTVEFDYNGEHRIVSPTDTMNGANPGDEILVGIQETKGWRRFFLYDIENIKIGTKPHISPEENKLG